MSCRYCMPDSIIERPQCMHFTPSHPQHQHERYQDHGGAAVAMQEIEVISMDKETSENVTAMSLSTILLSLIGTTHRDQSTHPSTSPAAIHEKIATSIVPARRPYGPLPRHPAAACELPQPEEMSVSLSTWRRFLSYSSSSQALSTPPPRPGLVVVQRLLMVESEDGADGGLLERAGPEGEAGG